MLPSTPRPRLLRRDPHFKPMRRLVERLQRLPRDRLAELVSAGSYGTVLVLGALSVIGASEVALGHAAELVAGVGVATWVAHLFAELLGEHVRRREPLRRSEIERAAVDGSPILAATVLPATVLLLGRLDVLTDSGARIVSIVVAVLQLLLIGAFVGRVAPARPEASWIFAAITASVGLAIVLLTVLLGH
jgi:hypothetical protein